MPGSGQWASLGFAVANDASHDEVWIVECRAIGVDQRIAEFAALVDRPGCLGRAVARNATPKENCRNSFAGPAMHENQSTVQTFSRGGPRSQRCGERTYLLAHQL